jgi:hypothetical protein
MHNTVEAHPPDDAEGIPLLLRLALPKGLYCHQSHYEQAPSILFLPYNPFCL